MKTSSQQHISFHLPLYLLISAIILSATACSTRIQVTEYPTHRENQLTAFTAYCWAEDNNQEGALEKIEPTGGHHNVFDNAIRMTISSNLNRKGYTEAACPVADFIIDYRMGLHEDVAAVDATFDESPINPYGPRWRIDDDTSVSYEGLAGPREEIITIRHGTIHIAAFSNMNKILWHSSAEKTLRDQDSDEIRKANLKKAIEEIMAGFPVKQKQ